MSLDKLGKFTKIDIMELVPSVGKTATFYVKK